MRAGVPSARSSRSARTSGVGRHSRRMSSTSPGMSTHGSVGHLLADQRHREQRREVVGADRLLGARVQRRLHGLGHDRRDVEPRGRHRDRRAGGTACQLLFCRGSFGLDRGRGRARSGSDRRRARAPRRRAPRRSPASAIRRASSTERMALSATATTSSGMRFASCSPIERSSPKSPRSRALTPRIRGSTASARSSSASSWTSTTTASPSAVACDVQLAEQAVVRQRGDDEEDGVGARRRGPRRPGARRR